MKDQKKILFVLDSNKYKLREVELAKGISQLCVPTFYYTDYENRLVKYLHGISVIGNFFSHITYWIISFLSAWDIFIRRRSLYADKIFINPIVGAFYCFLLALFKVKDNVDIAGFLFVPKKNKYYFAIRKRFVLFSYQKASKIIVYSNNEIKFYSELFPKLASKFKFVKYGREYDIFEEKIFDNNTSYIASGGISNRDFNSLACALKFLEEKQPNLTCIIATRPDTFFVEYNPKNLKFLYNIRIDTFGSFLGKSLFVIIPLKNTPLSAGHMALFEAMYRGKIILITDIPAVRDYVDENMVFFYEADNFKDMADKIEYLYCNRNKEDVLHKAICAQNVFLSTYCFIPFLKRIINT